MELTKQLKLINIKFTNNTGELPGFKIGNIPGLPGDAQRVINNVNNLEKPVKTVDVSATVGGAFGTLLNIIGSFGNYQSTDDILAEYKHEQANTAGISWDKMVHAENGKLPGFIGGAVGNILGATGAGAAAGSIVPGIGTAIGAGVGLLGSTIGSIFSSNKQKENERKAENYVLRYNNFSRDGAISTAQQLEDLKRYGDQSSQIMFNPGYSCGKLPKYSIGKDKINPSTGLTQDPKLLYTINGPLIGKANAKVEPEEGVSKVLPDGTVQFNRYNDGKARSKRPGDILYTYTTPDETIWTNNKDPYTGIRFSDEAEARVKAGLPLDDLQFRMAELQAAKKKEGTIRAKYGKLPGHSEGWLGNFVPAMIGGIAGLGQYLDAKNSKPYYPRTYAANPYETEALTTLAGLRINPYPIFGQLRNAEARTNRAIDIAGGLSGSQRTAARLANLNTTQNNIASVLSNIQQLNNAYKSNYAQAALNAGQQNRQARMSANQWDLDYYSKAHAARNRGMQTGIANMLAQIQQYQANEFKRRQFNETMALYRDDMDLRKKHMNWIQNNSGLNISQNADSTKNPGSQYWNQLLPTEKWLALYNRGIIG